MTLELSRQGPSLTERNIQQFESTTSIRLPNGYRGFLLQHNSGAPEPESFFMTRLATGEREEGCIGWLFGINTGNRNIEMEEVLRTYETRIPDNFLPIATDPGGNLICLSVYGDDLGMVYFWDHEWELDQGNVAGYENVAFIAQDFPAFLNALFSYNE